MTAFCLGGYIIIVIALGYTIVSAMCGSRVFPISELTALSLATGLGAIGMLMFYLSLAGMIPSRAALSSIAISVLMTLIALAKIGRLSRATIDWPLRNWGWSDAWLIVPYFLIGRSLLGIGIHALAFPMYEGDAFAIWGLRAKEVFSYPLIPRPSVFSDPSLAYAHSNYPLMLPFLLAGAYAAMGGMHDQMGKAVLLLPYLAMLGILHANLRRNFPRSSIIYAFGLTAIVVSLPAMTRWTGAGYSDVLLAMFHMTSIAFLIAWLRHQRSSDLILSTLFAAFAGFTKNEGLAMEGIAIIALLGWCAVGRDRWRLIATLASAVAFALLLLPFFVWRAPLPRSDEDYLSKLTPSHLVASVGRLPMIVSAMGRELLDPRRQGAVWIILLIAAALGYRAFRSGYVAVIWLIVVFNLLLYVAVCSVSPMVLEELLYVSVDRLMLHITPIAALLIGIHWSAIHGSADHNGAQGDIA